MSLPPGIYMVRNRATGYYIIPNDGSLGGVTVATNTDPGEVPANARISVQKDPQELYTFKSDSNLSIGVSTKKDELGDRYLEWQEGDYKWVVRSAGTAQWSIKLPNDPLYVIDDRTPPDQPVVPGSGTRTSDPKSGASKGTQSDMDNQIKVNISITIPFANGNTSSGHDGHQPTFRTANIMPGIMAMSHQVPMGDKFVDDNTGPVPMDASLVLKQNGGTPSCARWEFINAS